MKTVVAVFARSATVMALLCATCCAVAGPTNTAPLAGRANAAVKALDVKIPESLFEIPATTAEGHNPFFPNAHPHERQPFVTCPPNRAVMINGRSFEPDEEGNVKLPNGTKLQIKWEDIMKHDRDN